MADDFFFVKGGTGTNYISYNPDTDEIIAKGTENNMLGTLHKIDMLRFKISNDQEKNVYQEIDNLNRKYGAEISHVWGYNKGENGDKTLILDVKVKDWGNYNKDINNLISKYKLKEENKSEEKNNGVNNTKNYFSKINTKKEASKNYNVLDEKEAPKEIVISKGGASEDLKDFYEKLEKSNMPYLIKDAHKSKVKVSHHPSFLYLVDTKTLIIDANGDAFEELKRQNVLSLNGLGKYKLDKNQSDNLGLVFEKYSENNNNENNKEDVKDKKSNFFEDLNKKPDEKLKESLDEGAKEYLRSIYGNGDRVNY